MLCNWAETGGKLHPRLNGRVAHMVSYRPGRACSSLLVFTALSLAGCGPQATPSLSPAHAAAELRALTMAHARVVWVQDVEKHGDLAGRRGLATMLLGLDSDDGAGERKILPGTGAYTKPLFTSRGDRVVFTEYRRGLPRIGDWKPGEKVMLGRVQRIEARVVNWDGSGLRTIAPGCVIEVWADPATGKEWVYVQAGPHRGKELNRNAIYRYPLDEPNGVELIWDETPVDAMGEGSFQLSADGRRAAGLFPWPDAGVLDLDRKTWARIGTGCWTGMAPDNSYRLSIFDGAHRHLLMGTPDGRIAAKINLTTAEAMAGAEVYHPRWSNLPEFLAITGPYRTKEGQGISGDPGVEVFVGKFNEAHTAVESWMQVTSNKRGDYFPDMWIERDPEAGPFPEHQVKAARHSAPATTWPADTGGLVFLWEDGSRKNEVLGFETPRPRQCRTALRGLAHYGRYNVMRLVGNGTFVSDGGESDMLAALKAGSDLTIEATATAAGTTSRPTAIIAFVSQDGHAFFTLEQDGDQLVSILRTMRSGESEERRLNLGAISPGTAHHVAITYASYGELTGFLDGRKVTGSSSTPATFVQWTQARLVFGGLADGSASWSGELDGIAVYSIALDAQRIAAHAALNAERRADRQPVERAVVRATLRETTPIPPPASIAPYRRCLVVYRYDVDEVVSGTVTGDRLLVAHWGILDGRRLFENAPSIGSTHRLEIEPFDDHAQLLSERMDMGPTDFDLPMYYDPVPQAGNSPVEASEPAR